MHFFKLGNFEKFLGKFKISKFEIIFQRKIFEMSHPNLKHFFEPPGNNFEEETKFFELLLRISKIPQEVPSLGCSAIGNPGIQNFEEVKILSNSDMRAEEFFRTPLILGDKRLRGTFFENLTMEEINALNKDTQNMFQEIPDLVKHVESKKTLYYKLEKFSGKYYSRLLNFIEVLKVLNFDIKNKLLQGLSC